MQREKEPAEEHPSALDTARVKTRRHFRNLWKIVTRYSRIDEFARNDTPASYPPEPYRFKGSKLLSLLKTLPWLLLILFCISFLWDFEGYSAALWGYRLEFQGVLKIISVSGLIGFSTNWLAITMLFKPARKRPLLGHGLIPAQKERIAHRLSHAVADDLINPEIIKQKISTSGVISRYRQKSAEYIRGIIDDPGFREDIKRWIVLYVEEMIAEPEIRAALAERILVQIKEALQEKSFEKVALKAYSFIKGQEMQEIIEEALVRIPASVENGLNRLDDLMDLLPDKIDEHSEAIENIVTSLLYRLINQLNVQALVEENLNSYDEQQVSNIIRSASNEQLRYIQYLGAFLGMIGGFVIWEPLLSILVLATLVSSLVGLDALLLRHRQHHSVNQ